MEGFYRFDYSGATGVGVGALAFANGKVGGLDLGGGVYVGTYQETAGVMQGVVKVSNPTSVVMPLVTGGSVPAGGSFDVPFRLQSSGGGDITLVVQTPTGPVSVILKRVTSF